MAIEARAAGLRAGAWEAGVVLCLGIPLAEKIARRRLGQARSAGCEWKTLARSAVRIPAE